jgi:putative nucleotidyltransferase with HDIG domain
MISEAKIAEQLGQLPTLPASYYHIVQLANRETSSAADFEEAMRPDPALTANVLRLANSALFGVPRSIASIRHAVAILGVRRVVQAALGAAMCKVVPDHLPGYGMASGEYWRHSVAVAVYTSRIAQELHYDDPGTAFTAGLLHDIGKLMVGIFLAENLDDVLDKVRLEDNVFVTAEELVMGVDHTKVGMMVATRWQLPAMIANVVRYHHEPSEATEDQMLVDMVHLADCLAHSVGYGMDVGELSRRIDESVMVRLRLATRQLEAIASEALLEIDDLAKSLGENG